MNMKKGLAILLAGAICLPIAGCTEGGKNFSSGIKELRYRVSNDATSMVWVQKIIDDFNAEYKDKGYRIVKETTGSEYYQSLDSDFASSRAPDIVLMEIGTISAYLSQGYLLPLDRYLNKEGAIQTDDLWEVNDYFKWSKEEGLGADTGLYYALVKDWSPDFMLIYNKTMIKEYNAANPDDTIVISETEPLTWDEYYEIAVKMTKGGVKGTTMDFVPYKHLMEYVQMTGETLFTEDGRRVNMSFEGDKPVENGVYKAFEYYCKLQSGENAPADAVTSATTEGGGMERFKNKGVWSVWNGLYAFPQYELYKADFEIGIAPPPTYRKGEAYAATSAMVGHAINAKCKYPDIAYEFIQFYMTEGAKHYVGMGYNFPGLKTVAASDAFLKPEVTEMEPYTNYFYNFVMAENTKIEPLKFSPELSYNRMGTLLSIPFAKYFGGKQDLDQTIKEFCDLVEEDLEEW